VTRWHPYDREILRLAGPALGALAAEPLYVLVDTAVVGHLGTPQLGGLAVAGTVLTSAFWVFNFLAYGTTASVARLFGAERDADAAVQAVQAAWVAAVLGVVLAVAGAVLAVAGAVLAPQAVAAFGAHGAVAANGVVYLRISALGAPAVLLASAGIGYLRGVQDTRTTLVVAGLANALNLALEVALIYGLHLGIGASAAATVFAQSCAAVAYGVVVLRAVRRHAVPSLRPDMARIRQLLVVGRDLFVRTGSLLGALAVATAVATRMGDVEVAAHQIAFQLWTFLALVLDATAIAGQAMVGRLPGAGDADGARSAARRMVQWAVAAGVVFGVGVAALRPVLAPLFSDDHAVAALATDVLVVVAVLQPVNAVVFVLDGVLIGAGDLRYLAAAMFTSAAVFVPLAIAVLASGRGLVALWLALTVLMATRFAGNVARFAGPHWQVVGATREHR
jgi:putative MATE family efflux protein